MDNIIFLPSPDMLAFAYEDIAQEENEAKVAQHFQTLAERVREHSDEVKRYAYI